MAHSDIGTSCGADSVPQHVTPVFVAARGTIPWHKRLHLHLSELSFIWGGGIVNSIRCWYVNPHPSGCSTQGRVCRHAVRPRGALHATRLQACGADKKPSAALITAREHWLLQLSLSLSLSYIPPSLSAVGHGWSTRTAHGAAQNVLVCVADLCRGVALHLWTIGTRPSPFDFHLSVRTRPIHAGPP